MNVLRYDWSKQRKYESVHSLLYFPVLQKPSMRSGFVSSATELKSPEVPVLSRRNADVRKNWRILRRTDEFHQIIYLFQLASGLLYAFPIVKRLTLCGSVFLRHTLRQPVRCLLSETHTFYGASTRIHFFPSYYSFTGDSNITRYANRKWKCLV